jgi:acetyl-CoA carboxylase carboxyl transferase subunit alpha
MIILEHEKQIYAYENALKHLEEQAKQGQMCAMKEIAQLKEQLLHAKKQIYSQLSPMDRIAICRHPQRPKSQDYIQHLFKNFEQLHGDRLFKDDPSILCGVGYLDQTACVVVAQEKGGTTEERIRRNFGMTYPEGYRKALRIMKLAEKFGLPVISLIDTPGAFPGLEAEERGQGWAIANNLKQMATLKTPTIALLIGEGCSGGALGVGVCDRVLMLEHAYYSVISPEGCAQILWKDPGAKHLAAQQLKIHAEHLMQWGIIDQVIEEPMGGAHYDPKSVFERVKKELLLEIEFLSAMSLESLLEKRYQKYRSMGCFSSEIDS